MHPKKIAGFLFVAIAALMVSCSKKAPDFAKYIPKTSGYVIGLDLKEMVAKLEKDSLSVENLLTVLKDSTQPDKYAQALEIWQKFKNAGLDLQNKIFLAGPQLGTNGEDLSFEIVAGLKDAKKLEDFLTKMPEAPKVQKADNFSYVEKDGMTVGWNSTAVIVILNTKIGNIVPIAPSDNDEAAAPIPGSATTPLESLKKIFSIKKEDAIISIKEFNDLMIEKNDVAIFSNTPAMLNNPATSTALAMMPKVKELLNDTYSTTTINFENGKVAMNGSSYFGKQVSDTLSKYAGSKINYPLLEPFPSDNIGGVMAFSLNPKIILSFLKLTGFDALVNAGLAQEGISADDVVLAFKGDMALVVSDVALTKKTNAGIDEETYQTQEPKFKLLIAAVIGNKAAFDKIIALGEKMQLFTRQGNKIVMLNTNPNDSDKPVLGIENETLLFASTDELYNTYLAKKSKIGLSSEVEATFKNSAFATYVDVANILKAIPESVFDSTDVSEKALLTKSKEIFKNLSFQMDSYQEKRLSGKGEINFNSNKNSLSQLVSFLMYATEQMTKKNNDQNAEYQLENMSVDSATVGAGQ